MSLGFLCGDIFRIGFPLRLLPCLLLPVPLTLLFKNRFIFGGGFRISLGPLLQIRIALFAFFITSSCRASLTFTFPCINLFPEFFFRLNRFFRQVMSDEIELHIHLLSAVLRPAPGRLMNFDLLDEFIEHGVSQFRDILIAVKKLHKPGNIGLLRPGRCFRSF